MFDIFIDDLDRDQCDEFMFRCINKDHQGDELALMRAKWFDYRFLHPVIATYTYAQAYEATYKRILRANFGRKVPRVFKSYDLSKVDRPTLAGLWRGRQHADALCVPYDVYVDLAMRARLDYWDRTSMPRATHLYGDLVIERVIAGWDELQAGRLHYGAHQEFRTHRFVGTSAQLDHHEWLFGQAALRVNQAVIMRRFVDEDLIPAEKVVSRLGDLARSHFPD